MVHGGHLKWGVSLGCFDVGVLEEFGIVPKKVRGDLWNPKLILLGIPILSGLVLLPVALDYYGWDSEHGEELGLGLFLVGGSVHVHLDTDVVDLYPDIGHDLLDNLLEEVHLIVLLEINSLPHLLVDVVKFGVFPK